MFQGVSSSSFELPEYPSARAKQVSDRFVGYLSQEDALPLCTKLEVQLISNEEKQKLLKIFKPHVIEKLRNREPCKNFYLLDRGTHRTVWRHKRYPELVFKLMTSKEAAKQKEVARRSRNLVKKLEHCWVQIPRTASFEVDEISVYVEETLPLVLDFCEHQEFWARVIMHYQSTGVSESFKTNLEDLIRQIETLVKRIGFWDVGYHKLPEVRTDGRGVCGTSFGNVNFTRKNLAEGLNRLAHLVPISPIVDSLVVEYQAQIQSTLASNDKSEQEDPMSREEGIMQQFQAGLEAKRKELRSLQLALMAYDKNAWSRDRAFISELNASKLDADEQILANHLIRECESRFESVEADKCLSVKRNLHIQPGVSLRMSYTRERFLKVLEILREQHLVISWYDDYAIQANSPQENLARVSYFIHF
ncbi:MAG: hypothetical protein CK425_08495 [Parachlamydia sp.]|nr:MAG: hypothetical protein CK425_08495 [Parachlamydia sp.]